MCWVSPARSTQDFGNFKNNFGGSWVRAFWEVTSIENFKEQSCTHLNMMEIKDEQVPSNKSWHIVFWRWGAGHYMGFEMKPERWWKGKTPWSKLWSCRIFGGAKSNSIFQVLFETNDFAETLAVLKAPITQQTEHAGMTSGRCLKKNHAAAQQCNLVTDGW